MSLSFFVREPFMGPDVIRSQQRNPRNFLIDYNAWFNFLANFPESNYCGALLLSDEGTPVGWKHMNGFGCHTFRWTNREGGSVFVKYHWICQQEEKRALSGSGVRQRAASLMPLFQFTFDEAVKMCGEDPDYAKRDLLEFIEKAMRLAGR